MSFKIALQYSSVKYIGITEDAIDAIILRINESKPPATSATIEPN